MKESLKNLLWSVIFVIAAGGFFAFGFMVKNGYHSLGRQTVIVVAGVLLLIGLATAMHHLLAVMKGK